MKQKKASLSAFSILYILLLVIAAITWIMPESSGVKSASLGSVFMASYKGFQNALDVSFFIIILGGFLGIVQQTGALNSGITHLVKKLKGNEIIMIPILMTLFSIGGSTYGMAEESIPFYALLATAMVAAGFDSMVGASIVLLGAGVGVLGSTVNPFSTGIAIDSVNESFKALGITQEVNNGHVIILGLILWLSSLIIACLAVMKYAKMVKADKGLSILCLQEREMMDKTFAKKSDEAVAPFQGSMKTIMLIFAFTFAVMITSVIPWAKFGITIFEGWSSVLTGAPLGEWWFGELGMWFFFMGVIIGLLAKFTEKQIVDSFIQGAMDILSVVLIIAVARGVSVLMGDTGLDKWVLNSASATLQGLNAYVFAPLSYVLYMILSFVIPSTSGLATVSMPIMGPLAANLGYSPAVMVMTFAAACGFVNLFTPTSGVVMGGLAITHIEYKTYLSFVVKTLAMILVSNIVILTIAMAIL